MKKNTSFTDSFSGKCSFIHTAWLSYTVWFGCTYNAISSIWWFKLLSAPVRLTVHIYCLDEVKRKPLSLVFISSARYPEVSSSGTKVHKQNFSRFLVIFYFYFARRATVSNSRQILNRLSLEVGNKHSAKKSVYKCKLSIQHLSCLDIKCVWNVSD